MTADIRSLIASWDGLAVVTRYDPETESWIFIALHDMTLGMAVGGCRMMVYPAPEEALRDAMRLAGGMTRKWAAAGLPFGGGKSVLAVPRVLVGEAREALLRRFGRLVAELRGTYGTGEDLGTTPADMAIVAEETRYVGGLDPLGRHPIDPGPYTALGVFASARAAATHAWGADDFGGRPVLIQGVGDVGAPLARLFAEAGATVLVSDVDAHRVSAIVGELNATAVPPDEVYGTDCDVYAPCAVGGTLSRRTIPQLRCRIVAGSANNQLEEPDDAQRLRERGIVYVPDYVANSGGAIAFGMLMLGDQDEEGRRARITGLNDIVRELLAEADARGESPAEAAERRVDATLSRARARGSGPTSASKATV